MSASFFLFPDLIQNNGEVADNTVETAEHACNKHFPRGDLSQFVDAGYIEEFALNETSLHIEAFLYSFGVFCNNPRSCSCIFFRHSESGGTIQVFCQVGILSAFHSEPDDRVFVNAVVDACLAQLFTELGIVCNIDAFVVNHNAGNSLFQLCFQVGHSLLFFK